MDGDLMIDEVLALLQKEGELPARATNRMVLAAVKEVYRSVQKMDGRLASLETRLQGLETARQVSEAKEVVNVKWPFLLQQIFLPVVMTVVTALLLFGIGRATGQIP